MNRKKKCDSPSPTTRNMINTSSTFSQTALSLKFTGSASKFTRDEKRIGINSCFRKVLPTKSKGFASNPTKDEKNIGSTMLSKKSLPTKSKG